MKTENKEVITAKAVIDLHTFVKDGLITEVKAIECLHHYASQFIEELKTLKETNETLLTEISMHETRYQELKEEANRWKEENEENERLRSDVTYYKKGWELAKDNFQKTKITRDELESELVKAKEFLKRIIDNRFNSNTNMFHAVNESKLWLENQPEESKENFNISPPTASGTSGEEFKIRK